jgi:hypothetical protein
MNIQLLAFLLLMGRLVSETFIILVLRRQWRIRAILTHPRLANLRRILSLLAILVFIGNIYPLLLDLFTLFHPGIRTSQNVNLVGVFYSLGNSMTFMFASILIWTLYKLADVAIDVGELIAGNPPKEVVLQPKKK